MAYTPEQFDQETFLRDDLPQNQPLIQTQMHAVLEPGDCLFFHCLTFHAASRNHTTESKQSVVFTFRAAENLPEPGSRSAQAPELLLH